MERTPKDSYEAQPSPRHKRDREPIAHRSWRGAAIPFVLCHNLDSPSSFRPSLTIRVTSPRQHLPAGFFISQAQWPAFTSVIIRPRVVERPILTTSLCRSFLVNPKQ